MFLYNEIIKRTLRVPKVVGSKGNSNKIVRQLDVALLSCGFKMSAALMKHLAGFHPTTIKDAGTNILGSVKELVGDHVKHNTYFKEFPKNIPDTEEFWIECLIDALQDATATNKIIVSLATQGTINLLDLPKYGKYQHTYEEMLNVQEEFISQLSDRITILHLGETLDTEALRLYHALAESAIPINEGDIELLKDVSEVCIDDLQPESIPIRENKAVINSVRLEQDRDLLIDTPTDILRLACYLSEGDVTLTENTRFKSFSRKDRRKLLGELEYLIEQSPIKLNDIIPHKNRWKRLGEKLHSGEYQIPHAQAIFDIAYGRMKFDSIGGKIEKAFDNEEPETASKLLEKTPGKFYRSLDRLIRSCWNEGQVSYLTTTAEKVAKKVSGRVLLSVREHLYNRTIPTKSKRIFVNKKGTSWVTDETRDVLEASYTKNIASIIDSEIADRLPKYEYIVMDQRMYSIALPLTNKNKASGLGVMPRGSTTSIDSTKKLRFFVYWKEKSERTDYDLSALFLDKHFNTIEQISYTNLRSGTQLKHSGDIVEARTGASEFIDIGLKGVNYTYIIPQVNVFAGESFDQAEEAFFGYMSINTEQKGKPFEPRTVRMKGDLFGSGRISLPLVFINEEDSWKAKWMTLSMKGYSWGNATENNRLSSSLITKAIVDREYMPVSHIVGLLEKKAKKFSIYNNQKFDRPVVYIGLEVPEGLPEGSKTFTLTNLHELCPK
jgi:stress response protein SCP2